MKPKLKNTLVLLFVLFLTNQLFAQIPTDQDCLGAIPVCEGYYSQPNSYTGSGAYPNEIPTTGACPGNCMSDGELNCVWYYVTVQSDGLMGFVISPNNVTDDYDWAVYNLTFARCEDIFTQVTQLQASCNWSGTKGATGPNGNSGMVCQGAGGTPFNAMIPVQEGENYVINISNYSSTQYGYALDFSMSTAQIYDDVPPVIDEIYDEDVHGCNTNTMTFLWSENVLCERVEPSYFDVTGPGGPYTVTDVQGIACELGGTWEKEFVLTVDPPFASNGEYVLHVLTLFPGIVDACNNPAESDQIPFFLDLGAPDLDTSAMNISPATCGMDNGSITGLSASGQTSITYNWKNSFGTIVGNSIDLINVPPEYYTLEIYDLNSCITYGGPWEVSDFDAPDINDQNVVIVPSNYGVNNGSITGILVNGLVPITDYIWTDDQGGVVGNVVDLIDVSSGYYDLTVVDENTCEAYAGPYFVGELGGPLTTNPIANPSTICFGEQVQLSPGAGGGSGTYEYSWTSTPEGFSSNLENPVVAPTENTTYHLQLWDGYIAANGSVLVTVLLLPVPDAGIDQAIPHGIYTFLEGSASMGSGDYNYFWAPVDKLEDAAVQNPQTRNLYETTHFFLTIIDEQTGCESSGPDEVIVNITGGMLNVNPIALPDTIVCLNETFELYANAGGGSGLYNYQWTDTAGVVLSNEASFELSLSEAGVYYFYLKVDDGYNDIYGYVRVRVDPAPVINLGSAIQYVCVHETITLDAENPGSSYLWSNGDTNQYTTMGTTGLGYDEQTLSVHVVNTQGCMADASTTIIFDYDYCVGVGELANGVEVELYPNPTNGMLNLNIDGVSGNVRVHIRTAVGTSISEHTFKPDANKNITETLDLSNQARGIYFLIIEGDNFYHTAKVLLQ